MVTEQININMDVRCKSYGQKGAAPNGLCLACIIKKLDQIINDRKPMTHSRK